METALGTLLTIFRVLSGIGIVVAFVPATVERSATQRAVLQRLNRHRLTDETPGQRDEEASP